jgi:hypothetical protein
MGLTEEPLTCQMSLNSEDEENLMENGAPNTFRKNLERTQKLLESVADDRDPHSARGIPFNSGNNDVVFREHSLP